MVCNAEAIRQITTRREHFPKCVETYEILRQFGDNVLAAEGITWRIHRKATSASFNEKNAALVFKESIQQARGLVKMWMGPDGEDSGTISALDHDTMRLTLNIISYVGFGLNLLWPGESLPSKVDKKTAKYGSLHPTAGHKMSFVTTIATFLEHILMLLLLPRWLLRYMPFKTTQLAIESFEEFGKYMQELMDEKIEEACRGECIDGMDLMGQLVRSSYGTEVGRSQQDMESMKGVLSRDEIHGNAFIMLAAGHETTANAIHFILLELANNPGSQRRLQRDIDEILGNQDPTSWDYESLISPMMASMLGACMNETLRMTPAVVEIPKEVLSEQGQVIIIDDKSHWIPRNTVISLVAVSVHRNPRYWPGRPSQIRDGEDDINDWVPERWYRKNQGPTTTSPESEEIGTENEDFGGYEGPDTSAQLFRPERGSYIPFSDGPRSCLGRRIAQVKIIAALAVLFRDYSLELAVDNWASDEEIERMDLEARREVYTKAQFMSRQRIRGATSVLTLKINDGYVPVRLVKRGRERYNSWLKTKKKGELENLAESVGLLDVDGYKKDDLGVALDNYLTENSSRFLANPDLAGYFNSRSKAQGSPIKREVNREDGLKVVRRRPSKPVEEITPEHASVDRDDASRVATVINELTEYLPNGRSDDASSPQATSTALIETPGRALSEVASRIALPATPADVALAVDRSTSIVRQRVSSLYEESGITEVSHATRDTLSTVTSILFCVAGWELWNVRREVLSNVYAFTIPAISALGTPDYPIYVPDMFLLLTSSFWSPALTWMLTSVIIPSFAGYFFNLSATSPPPSRGRPRPNHADYVVDPLTFSIVKALVSFVVYGQGVNFGGLLNDMSIVRLENAIYGGYKGILTGTAITGLVSIYDAVLRK
ncbi:cytochrome P450 [Fusarium austroafricanum]|uniref:Cytochrome P450 n=1 Tax=Fusarium austroafricanum TaxID=2364996 RepID=A0A8H4KU14_9HYPO|nr:cytochrome P450 [Fusarium austroafricanum]